MAGVDVRISELPAATEGHADDRFETTQVDGATLVSRSITLEQVSDAVAAVLPPPVSDWADITGKPSTFPPTVPIAWTDVSGKPATFPPTIPTGGAIATWPYLPLTGGTLTGALTGTTATMSGNVTSTGGNIVSTGGYIMVDRTGDAAPAFAYFQADAAQSAGVYLRTGTSARWQMYKNSTAEGGADAGSDFVLINCNDAGTALTTVLFASRATGYVNVGGAALPAARLHVRGVGQSSPSVDTSTTTGAAIFVQDTTTGVAGSGGMVMFGAGAGAFASVKAHVLSNTPNTSGDLVISTRRANADATLTETARFLATGATTLAGALTGTSATMSGAIKAQSATAIPAGGTAGAGFTFSSTANFGTIFGSGAPTAAAARGSLYLRSDGGGPYVNTDGATAWSAVGGAVAVGTTAPSSPTDGSLWFYSDASNGGGALYLRYNDGNTTQWVPASPAATPGSLLQTVFTETGAVATGTTIIPFDDTIPQIGEGNEYLTCVITPKSATSKLTIALTVVLSSSVANTITAALFQDSTANALAASVVYQAQATGMNTISFGHTMTSGTTSATTFRVRAGGLAAGTTTFNGSGAARIYGGTMASSIVIQEVA